MAVIAIVVFVCLAGAVALGMTLSRWLAAHHLSSESRDTVKLALGLVATLAALLLGLLVSSAKGTFDAEREQVNALAAKIATLDRVLALYGAEAAGARGELRIVIEGAIAQIWPTRDGASSDLSFDAGRGEAIFRSIASLNPANPLQSDLKSRAIGLAFELISAAGRARPVGEVSRAASRVGLNYQPPERSSNGRIFMNASTAWIWPS